MDSTAILQEIPKYNDKHETFAIAMETHKLKTFLCQNLKIRKKLFYSKCSQITADTGGIAVFNNKKHI